MCWTGDLGYPGQLWCDGGHGLFRTLGVHGVAEGRTIIKMEYNLLSM